MDENFFDWVPAYEAIATALLDYKDRQGELAALIGDIIGEDMSEMDPFTFFSAFNGKRTQFGVRTQAVSRILDFLNIDAVPPVNFNGVPVTNALRWQFWDGQPSSIEHNWQLFEAALAHADNPTEATKADFVASFDMVRAQKNIGDANLTMGLFWVRPEHYLPLDNNTTEYLWNRFDLSYRKPITGENYLSLVDGVRAATNRPFVEVSHSAWELGGWIPAPMEYDPQISKDMWVELLDDASLVSNDMLIALACLHNQPGGATCTELANEYGRGHSFYQNSIAVLGQRVADRLSLEVREVENGKYWPVTCVGSKVGAKRPGQFAWRLRPELAEALDELGTDDIPLVSEEGTMATATEISYPKNLILYGPPGTGKTYRTTAYAVAICDQRDVKDVLEEMKTVDGHERVIKRYQELKDNGRIRFTTFHQSYGYEEFIEGLRPEYDDVRRTITYPATDGVFKKFCRKAEENLTTTSVQGGVPRFEGNPHPRVWKMGLSVLNLLDECRRDGCLRMAWDYVSPSEVRKSDEITDLNARAILAFQEEMQPGDFVIIPGVASDEYGVAVVTGNFEWRQELDEAKRYRSATWLKNVDKAKFIELNGGKQLTLQTVYELPRIDFADLLGIMGLATRQTDSTAAKPYVFIIDEINRGNISKIFGELITLIEPKKRLGEPEQMKVELPYTNKDFGVPTNVYIVGTMNTADRSIALMDTALRRRFDFEEMMPQPELLSDIDVDGVDLKQLLETLNQRIEVLYDREHTLGHSFFMQLTSHSSIEELARVFDHQVIPLLQEYFFDDYAKIRSVFGAAADSFVSEQDASAFFWTQDDNAPQEVQTYRIQRAPKDADAYKRIYDAE